MYPLAFCRYGASTSSCRGAISAETGLVLLLLLQKTTSPHDKTRICTGFLWFISFYLDLFCVHIDA